jgi:Arc/MetJ-type ribon-helix-helix transcriptional regulator
MFTKMTTVQVQVRLPVELAKQIDKWVGEGKFVSRSDAIKAIVAFYSERENTRKFYEMLEKRRKESSEHPERLVPLEKIN